MKIDFVKTLEASSPYTPGRIYFEESTSLIKVATASNQYRVFGGVRSADYDSSTDILTILNGNGDEVYIDFSQYVNQDEYEDDQYVISVALTELNNSISSISDNVDYLGSQVSDMGYSMQELQNSIENFYFVEGTSSQAGNSTSGSRLSTKWEGTIQGGAITQVYNGLKIAYRINTNTGVGTAGAVLSIDGGTNYYPVVYNVNNSITTRYGVGSTILMTFNSTQTATAYLTSNTSSTVTGCWQVMDYDNNTDTKVRQYQYGDNAAGTAPEYPILTRYNLTNKNGSYEDAASRFYTGTTINTTTGALTATAFIKSGGTASQFLKADGTIDSNSYITSSDIPAMTTDASVAAWGYTKNALTGINFNGVDASVTNGVASISVTIPENNVEIIEISTNVDTDQMTSVPSGTFSQCTGYIQSGKSVILRFVFNSNPLESVDYLLSNVNRNLSGISDIWFSCDSISFCIYSDDTTECYNPGYLDSYSPAAGITSTDITNWNNKVSNVQSDWNATTGLAAILNKPDLSLYMTIEDYEEDEEVVAASLNDLNDRILALISQIPTDASVSGWGYIKSYTETDPTVPSWAKAANKPTYTAAEVGALPDTTTIPTQTTDASVAAWGYIKTIVDASIAALGYTKNAGTLTGVKFNNVSATINGTVAEITATIPPEVTESTVSGWGFTKNTGTLTSHADHKLLIGSASATAASGNTITYVESLTGTSTATHGDLTVTPTLKTITIPSAVTESTVSGWGFTKNTGTLTEHATHKLTATNNNATSTSGTITFVESLTGTNTATSGDLTITATRKSVTIPAAQVQSDWNATSGMGVILNKPTIPSKIYELTTTWDTFVSDGTTIPSGMFTNIITDIDNGIIPIIYVYFSDDDGANIFYLHNHSEGDAVFRCIVGDSIRDFNILTNDSYSFSTKNVELTNNRVTSVSSSSTDLKYPTAKAVYNSVKDLAPKASPAFTGTPTAPTAATNTNNTQIATTAFVKSVLPTVNNATLTIQKNGTTVNTFTANSSSNVTANIQVNELPTVTANDNGKILRVVSGAWAAATPITVYSGSNAPNNLTGINGDIYIQS